MISSPVAIRTNQINGVYKTTKPFNTSVTSGQFDPRVLASLTRFNHPVSLPSSTLRSKKRQVTPPINDPVGDLVTVTPTTLTSSERTVNVDWLMPQTVVGNQYLVYFHGLDLDGGNPADTTTFLKLLADRSHCNIINVHYSTKPAPEGILDGLTVVQALARIHPQTQLTIAGDAIGANLALAVASLNRQYGNRQIQQQLLLYPITAPAADHTGPFWDIEQYPIVAEQQRLFEHYHAWFQQLDTVTMGAYLPSQIQATDPLITPINQSELQVTPPTTIMIGEFDPFRLQAWDYAQRLAAADVKTSFVQYQGQKHGFAPRINQFWQATDVVELMAQRLIKPLI